MRRLRKWGIAVLATTSLVTVVLLLTGWGTAVAGNISSVFVTNDSNSAVPVLPGVQPGYFSNIANVVSPFDYSDLYGKVIPAGATLRITSITFTDPDFAPSAAGVQIGTSLPSSGSCSFSDATRNDFDFQSALNLITLRGTSEHFAFPEPLVLGRQVPWCLEAHAWYFDSATLPPNAPNLMVIGYRF